MSYLAARKFCSIIRETRAKQNCYLEMVSSGEVRGPIFRLLTGAVEELPWKQKGVLESRFDLEDLKWICLSILIG